MIKTIKEFIPQRADQNGRLVKEHWCEYSYDTKNIKKRCVDCDAKIKHPTQNYIARGNYCNSCQANHYSDKILKLYKSNLKKLQMNIKLPNGAGLMDYEDIGLLTTDLINEQHNKHEEYTRKSSQQEEGFEEYDDTPRD